jgi:predicted nucleic acid-binding protein
LIVADASVLIALAKMRRLELLKHVHGQVAVGPIVKEEVLDKGKAISALGVGEVERGLDQGWIQVLRVTAKERKLVQRLLKTTRLDPGEAESLAIAHSRKLMLIVDDREARAVAGSTHIEFIGTAGFLLEAFLKKRLDFQQLEEAVKDLSRVTWLSPAVVTEILKKAREARR